jgi:hypothetical protein
MSYKILKVVDADEVPDWERRPPKWSELVEAVLGLKPNQSLEVEFDDAKVAERARNAVRDAANLEARAVVVRTRVVKKEGGGAILYLTRVNPTPAK